MTAVLKGDCVTMPLTRVITAPTWKPSESAVDIVAQAGNWSIKVA